MQLKIGKMSDIKKNFKIFEQKSDITTDSVIEIMGQDEDGVTLMLFDSSKWEPSKTSASAIQVAGAFIREYMLYEYVNTICSNLTLHLKLCSR